MLGGNCGCFKGEAPRKRHYFTTLCVQSILYCQFLIDLTSHKRERVFENFLNSNTGTLHKVIESVSKLIAVTPTALNPRKMCISRKPSGLDLPETPVDVARPPADGPLKFLGADERALCSWPSRELGALDYNNNPILRPRAA